MTSRVCILLLAAVSAVSLARGADACSTFCVESQDGPVFGKNYDWGVDVGLVMVNKRGVEKRSMTRANPARWRSRYGSVTFNQYGREFPNGGMNEAGLVVELMWLDSTEYPEPDQRASVTTLEWVQYQLDNAATVADVTASDGAIRIIQGAAAAIHFLVADAGGACASIEFLDGKLVAHTGTDMPARALTNHTYEQSLDYAGRFGGGAELPRSSRSLDRFVRAAHMADSFVGPAAAAVQHAFGILADVAQGDYTKWSIVYDIGSRRVNFRTRVHHQIRYLDLSDLDFACDTPVTMIDVNTDAGGDLSVHMRPYTTDANRALLAASFGQTDFLRDTDKKTLDLLARVPESTTCAPAAGKNE
jgi:choloylglycine hydrolase